MIELIRSLSGLIRQMLEPLRIWLIGRLGGFPESQSDWRKETGWRYKPQPFTVMYYAADSDCYEVKGKEFMLPGQSIGDETETLGAQFLRAFESDPEFKRAFAKEIEANDRHAEHQEYMRKMREKKEKKSDD